jgi:hypothetical protein
MINNKSNPKPITQQRILSSLEKADRYLHKRPEVAIAKALINIGLSSRLGVPLSPSDELELAYQGFTDPEQVLKRLSRYQSKKDLNSLEAIKEAWGQSYHHTVEKHWKRLDKIHRVQQKHKVSGLEFETVTLGDVVIKYHSQIDSLETLPYDFQLLKNECPDVAKSFCDAVQKYNMTLWLLDSEQDQWVSATYDQVLSESHQKALATVWESKYYINQHELETKGYATQKSSLDSLQDSLTWEFHLTLADELYPDVSSDSTWFCANLWDGKPRETHGEMDF